MLQKIGIEESRCNAQGTMAVGKDERGERRGKDTFFWLMGSRCLRFCFGRATSLREREGGGWVLVATGQSAAANPRLLLVRAPIKISWRFAFRGIPSSPCSDATQVSSISTASIAASSRRACEPASREASMGGTSAVAQERVAATGQMATRKRKTPQNRQNGKKRAVETRKIKKGERARELVRTKRRTGKK